MADQDKDAVNRAVFGALSSGKVEPLTLDAVMESAGGNAAETWKVQRHRSELGTAMSTAQDAYWDAQDLAALKIETVAALRLAEGALTRTPLTPELRKHGWNKDFNRAMADRLARYRKDVENDCFSATDVGQRIGRSMLTQVSPAVWDVDELKVAVGQARRMLEHLARRVVREV